MHCDCAMRFTYHWASTSLHVSASGVLAKKCFLKIKSVYSQLQQVAICKYLIKIVSKSSEMI
jgi:hypothetical protein